MKRVLITFIVCVAMCLPVTAAAKPTFISIGTGGTGGVYYPYGGGLAEAWTKNVKGVKAVAEVTGASVENVKLAHRGETVVGMIMGDVAFQAYNGVDKFEAKPQNVLAMASMYPNVLQLVTLKGSGIKNVTDFAGKNISLGAPGSGTAFMANLVLKAIGVDTNSFDTTRLSFNETANALKDGTIDAGFWVVAPGTSSIMDLATTHDIASTKSFFGNFGFLPKRPSAQETGWTFVPWSCHPDSRRS